MQRKFKLAFVSTKEQFETTKSFAAPTVNADATSAKLATKWQLSHRHPAAETVIVAAAAPNVKTGRLAPWPRPKTFTPATLCAMLVAVTVSAWPGRT